MIEKIFVCLAALVAITLASPPGVAAFGAPFMGYDTPYYTSATYGQYYSFPGVGLRAPGNTYSGFIGNDPANGQLAVDLGAFKTYVLPNITYNVINGPGGVPAFCLKVTGYTYDYEVAQKMTAIMTELDFVVDPAELTASNSDKLVLTNHFFGFVADPGAGFGYNSTQPTRIAYDAYVSVVTGTTRRVKFAQNIPVSRHSDGSCPPSPGVLVGIINTPEPISVTAPAGFYTPPFLCNYAVEYVNVQCLAPN